MGQHDASVTFSVNVSVDYASVIGRKGNSLLRGGDPRKQQRHNDGNKRTHAANVLLLGQIRLVGIMGMCIPGFPRTLWEKKDRVLSGSSANRKLGLSPGTGPRRTAHPLTTLSVLIRISIGEQKANIRLGL